MLRNLTVIYVISCSFVLTGCPEKKTQVKSLRTPALDSAENTQSSADNSSAANSKPINEKSEKPKVVPTEKIGIVNVHSEKIELQKTSNVDSDLQVSVNQTSNETKNESTEQNFVKINEVSSIPLTPNTEYQLIVQESTPSGERTTIEEQKIVTLAQEPALEQVVKTQDGKFELTIDIGRNPADTEYTVAVVNQKTEEVLAYINPESGGLVKAEEKWSTISVDQQIPNDEDGKKSVIELDLIDLGADQDSITFSVQAKNRVGDETELSDLTPVTDLTFEASIEAESTSYEQELAVPSNAPVPTANQILSSVNGLKGLEASVNKSKTRRKELLKQLKVLKNDRKDLIARSKNDSDKNENKGKKSEKKSEKEVNEKDEIEIKEKLQYIEAAIEKTIDEMKSLLSAQRAMQKIMSAKMSELKKLKKTEREAKNEKK